MSTSQQMLGETNANMIKRFLFRKDVQSSNITHILIVIVIMHVTSKCFCQVFLKRAHLAFVCIKYASYNLPSS